MRLLSVLTLGYTAVLVSALAGSLIAILVQLRRIGGVLGDVGSVLTRVRDETEPLGSYLQPVQDASGALAGRMGATRASLARANDALGAIVEHPEAAR